MVLDLNIYRLSVLTGESQTARPSQEHPTIQDCSTMETCCRVGSPLVKVTHLLSRAIQCTREHMSIVDPFNGSTRAGEDTRIRPEANEDEHLLLVSPGIDGRLRDEDRV